MLRAIAYFAKSFSLEVIEKGTIGTLRKLGYGILFALRRTTALSCITSEIRRDTGCNSRLFFYTALALDDPLRGICHKVWYGKTKL